MLSTAIIIFRETLEISMILSVVLAATRGLAGRMRWILGGFLAGLSGAGVVALFAEAISNAASGMGQEFFNALILFTAATVIGWTAVWVRIHAREMVTHFREVGQEVTSGKLPGISLAVVIGLALLREGSEIVLFIYSMTLTQSVASIIFGSIFGLLLGSIVGAALYFGIIKMSPKYMFKVTGILLILLVAGLSAQGAGYLTAAGFFSTLSTPLWNTSWLLSEDSVVGKALHSLIGYTARPSLVQLMFYMGTLLGLFCLTTYMEKNRKVVTAIAVIFTILAVTPMPVLALDEIYSPNVEYRELSVEWNGSRTFDNNPQKNNIAGEEFVVEAGILPRVTIEASAGFTKDPGDAMRWDHMQGEGRFQFFEQGEMWADSGLLLAYDHAIHAGDADGIEAKLLLQKDFGKFTSIINTGFSKQLVDNAAGNPDYVFLLNTRYRFSPEFQPGIELQSDLGQGATLRHFSEQQQYAGAAVWGKLWGSAKYQVGLFAGLTDASSSVAARGLLEYEFHF